MKDYLPKYTDIYMKDERQNSSSTDEKPKKVKFEIFGKEMRLLTASGVFSFGKFDRGTELLTKAIEKPGGSLLDLGCGNGIIGISLAVFFEKVVMVDVNDRAVWLTKKNIKLNSCKNCKAVQSDGLSAVKDEKFDVIATNPPTHAGKTLIFSWIEQVKDYLVPKGAFYLVCKTKLGARSYEAKIEEEFGNCETIKKGSGYRVFRAILS